MPATHKIKQFGVYAALFTLALILRLPYLMLYPVFRVDELGENLRAYAIIKLGFMPLTNNAPFIGAFYNYLAALSYLAMGSAAAFRLLVAITGALAVPTLYAVALKLTKIKYVSLLAALLLAFSPMHILISSHVAWSASLMPLFLLAAILAFFMALEKGGRAYWVLLGVFLGLSLQSHPSILASYAGLVLLTYVVLGKESLVKLFRNFRYVLLGFIGGYANMIAYNIAVPFGSVTYVFSAKWTGLSSGLTAVTYLRRLLFLIVEYASGLAAGVPVITLPYLLSSWVFYVLTAIVACLIIYGAAKSKLVRGILLYLVISLLILAIGTKGTMTMNPMGFAWGPHYLQQLLPLTYLMIAESVSKVKAGLSKLIKRRYLTASIALLISAVILLWPFTNLIGVYKFMTANHCTNEVFIDTVEWVKSRYGKDTPTFIWLSKRDQALTLVFMLAVLEGMHPQPDVKLLKNARANIIGNLFKEFVSKLSEGAHAVIIIKPDKQLAKNIVEYLHREGLIVEDLRVIRVRANLPIYTVIVARR